MVASRQRRAFVAALLPLQSPAPKLPASKLPASKLLVPRLVLRKLALLGAVRGWLLVASPHAAHAQVSTLRAEANHLQAAQPVAFQGLQRLWRRLDGGAAGLKPHRQAGGVEPGQGVVVVIGDSHVQQGGLAAALRDSLQAKGGDGGHGWIAPWSVTGTYAPQGYKTLHEGVWTSARGTVIPPKDELGLGGLLVRTVQPGALLHWEFDKPQRPSHLRIYSRGGPRVFDVQVTVDGQPLPRVKLAQRAAGQPFSELRLPRKAWNKLTLQTVRRDAGQGSLDLWGLVLQTPGRGVVVHNVGLGGARWRLLLHEARLQEQLASLRPDVVFVEFGTNDILYGDAIQPQLQGEIQRALALLRQTVPQATVVTGSVQDLYWHGNNLTSTAALSALTREAAFAAGAAFWDWFAISGGQGTLPAWQAAALARKDMVHLTAAGYTVKGEWLVRALGAAALSAGAVQHPPATPTAPVSPSVP